MANLIVSQGLQRIADTISRTSGYSVSRYIQTLSIDDSAVAFTAGDTALNSGGAVTNEFDVAFDSTPTRSGQTVTHLATIPTGSGNFTIKRIALHDDTAANVTSSSTTLVGGVDGQTLVKTSSFSITFTLTILYTNV